ncbi:hypothetical protein C6P45_004990 [Maudiozyma exigua]|uniref:Anoctamin transmembrane domain-containing protein n=1 Tax=Maudiozyma exigua TaxID=34358 RepID=A0A9P6W9I0_MAUEX|nr:hypothetical protein C6P45_004990 [Kazachstania exigua]
MLRKHNTLEELDPNCVVIFKSNDNNKKKLLAMFETFNIENNVPVNLRFEHGHQLESDYLFIRVDNCDIDVYLTTTIKELSFVQDIIPLYDTDRSKKLNWLFDKTFKQNIKSLPSDDDLKLLNNLTNYPKVSLYFAFFKYYNRWLGYLAIPGIFTYYFSNENSWEFNRAFTILNVLWSIAFITSWIYNKQLKYKSLFGSFRSVYSIIGLPSGSTPANSVTSRIILNLVFLPVLAIFGIILVAFQFACFLLEIYISQIYDGPMASILSLLPTILISVFVPILSLIYNKYFVDKFILFEKPIAQEKSKLEKNFIIKFCSSYIPLLITLFVYLPLSYLFTPETKLELSTLGFPVKSTDYIVNTTRHQSQFFYFIVTNSLILFATDNVVPFILNRLTTKKTKRNQELMKHRSTVEAKLNRHGSKDLEIWSIVNGYQTSAWSDFDTDINFQKLIIQFGYIAMFTTIWPIAPAILFAINIIVLKVDYWKVTSASKPKLIPGILEAVTTSDPTRTDITKLQAEMSPWNGMLRIIVWISTLVAPALTIMYRSCYLPGIGSTPIVTKEGLWYNYNPIVYDWPTILVSIMVTEHIGIVLFFILKSRYVALHKPIIIGGFVPTLQGDITEISKPSTSTTTIIEPLEKIASKEKINQYIGETNELIHRETKRTEPLTSNSKEKSFSSVIISSDSSSDATLPPSYSTPEIKNPTHLDLHKVSSVDLRAPIKDISKLGSSDSVIAGATIPKMIPTSKNFDSRNTLEQQEASGPVIVSTQQRTSTPLKNVIATRETEVQNEKKSTDKITIPQRSNTKKSVKTQQSTKSTTQVSPIVKVTEPKKPVAVSSSSVSSKLSQPPPIDKSVHQNVPGSLQSSIKDTQSNNSGARHQQDVSVARQTSKKTRPKSMVIPDHATDNDKKKKKKRGLFGKIKNVL